MKQYVTAFLLAVASVAQPAQAASCWTSTAAEAAQVRDFETMLMVSALRCRISGTDFVAGYNRFINEKRLPLTAVNDALRAQFRDMVGERASLDTYDRFVTAIANSYGGGAQGMGCQDFQSLLDAANAMPATQAALVTLAQRAGADPRLPGQRCDVTMAMISVAPSKPVETAALDDAVRFRAHVGPQ